MAVLSHREVLPRQFSHRFGSAPTAELKYHATTDGPTATQDVIDAIGIIHGSRHPEHGYLYCVNATVSEIDRYHVEATYSFESPSPALSTGGSDGGGGDSLGTIPYARADIWSFSSGSASVAAVRYYDGTDNETIRPLVNTAGDPFEGATTDETEIKATITGNRLNFPLSLVAAVSNAVNSDSYLNAAPYHWKCTGISADPQTEVVGNSQVFFWTVTVELTYRQSGWNLLLPNVGFNFIEGGTKKRAYVLFDGERVASASVVALNDDGSMRSTPPDDVLILERRVNRAIPFSQFFGTPPF